MKGVVKWFSEAKGFGFIAKEEGGDVFFHHTSIKMPGYRTLAQGDKVEFDVVSSDKGPRAANVVKYG